MARKTRRLKNDAPNWRQPLEAATNHVWSVAFGSVPDHRAAPDATHGQKPWGLVAARGLLWSKFPPSLSWPPLHDTKTGSEDRPTNTLPSDAAEALVLEMAPGRRGHRRDDVLFDRFLPRDYRLASRQFWSPLEVVARAARWLDELGIETVVDVGSGVGKFCIAGALAGRSTFIGIEQRGELVRVARGVAGIFGLGARVRFIEGTFGEVTVPTAHCYYFFNPFGESLFDVDERLDGTTEVSHARSLQDIHFAERLLEAAPLDTYVMTYNGFGGSLSDTYELLRSDSDFPCALRLARKRRSSCAR
jgi:hypothetical protein